MFSLQRNMAESVRDPSDVLCTRLRQSSALIINGATWLNLRDNKVWRSSLDLLQLCTNGGEVNSIGKL